MVIDTSFSRPVFAGPGALRTRPRLDLSRRDVRQSLALAAPLDYEGQIPDNGNIWNWRELPM